MSFFAELKRRNVIRVGIAYVVICWALAQVAEFAVDNFDAPVWALRVFVVFLMLGLPLVLFLAWIYELTPDGVKREKDIDRSQSITKQTGRKLDFVIIGVLVVAVGLLLFDRFYVRENISSSAASGAKTIQSIAVLPFVNLSNDEDYFADGLSEELLNLLAQISDLKVAGRTSSFAFKGRNEDFKVIGDALNVEHVLEGSVRRSGDRLRVTAQLINVDDGYHVWSETYDRRMADIFEIQDDVAGAITEALRLRLSPRSNKPTHNVEAYALYLEALPYIASNDDSDVLTKVVNLLDRAIKLDPTFAKAHEAKALAYWMTSGDRIDERAAVPLILNSASTALKLDGSLVLARLLSKTNDPDNWNWGLEFDATDAAIQAAPDEFNIFRIHCANLFLTGYLQEMLKCGEHLIELEPLSSLSHYRMANVNSALGRRSEARDHLQRGVELGGLIYMWDIAFDHLIAGENEAAIRVLESHQDTLDKWDIPFWSATDARQILAAAADAENGAALLDAWFAGALARASDFATRYYVYYWYLVLGRIDDYWRAIEETGSQNNWYWATEGYLLHYGMAFPQTGFTRHPTYLKYAKESGLIDLWEARGAPDRCSKVDGEWVCE